MSPAITKFNNFGCGAVYSANREQCNHDRLHAPPTPRQKRQRANDNDDPIDVCGARSVQMHAGNDGAQHVYSRAFSRLRQQA